MRKREPPLKKLGEFLVVFQAVEASVTDMIEFVINADREYVHTLAAELEFCSKLHALDVIFSRWARINELTLTSPHAAFHKLMSSLEKLASRRNEIVHSFYNLLITVDGTLGLTRRPTRLRSSKGERHDPPEDILPESLIRELEAMRVQLQELDNFRQLVHNTRFPPQ